MFRQLLENVPVTDASRLYEKCHCIRMRSTRIGVIEARLLGGALSISSFCFGIIFNIIG